MTLREEVDLMRRIPFFAQIEPSKLKLIAFTSERIAFEPGQIIFQQGDIADAAYIIIEGSADILVNAPNGPIVVAEVGRDSIVGEVGILCGVPRTATVKARQRLVCLRIAKEQFLQLIKEFPQIAYAVMREMALRLEAATLKLRSTLIELETLQGLRAE